MEIKVTSLQSVIDIAVQSSGSAVAAFEMAVQNGFSITDDLSAGQQLFFASTSENQLNKRNFKEYKLNNIHPATALTKENMLQGGIGYMGIQIDFIIS